MWCSESRSAPTCPCKLQGLQGLQRLQSNLCRQALHSFCAFNLPAPPEERLPKSNYRDCPLRSTSIRQLIAIHYKLPNEGASLSAPYTPSHQPAETAQPYFVGDFMRIRARCRGLCSVTCCMKILHRSICNYIGASATI